MLWVYRDNGHINGVIQGYSTRYIGINGHINRIIQGYSTGYI